MGHEPTQEPKGGRLVRRKPLTARKPLRRQREADPKPRRYTGPPADVRQIVWDRCGARCERCGAALTSGAVSLHHRHARQMGGTRNPAVNDVSNLMYLCGSGNTGCHGWVESHRDLSYQSGWLVRSRQDPSAIPALIHDLGFMILTSDGRYQSMWKA